MNECKDFLENLAKYHECTFKLVDLNKFQEYKKYLTQKKSILTKYSRGDFDFKDYNFVGIFVKNNEVVLCGNRRYSKAQAILSLKDTYTKKRMHESIQFNYAKNKTDELFNRAWLNVSSASEVKLHLAIEGKN